MAGETQSKASEPAPASEVAVAEKAAAAIVPTTGKPAKEEAMTPAEETRPTTEAAEEKKAEEVAAAAATVPQSVSFKEESNLVGDLKESEKKALDELKQLVQTALANNEFKPPPPPPPPAAPAPTAPAAEEQPPAVTKEEEEAAKPEEPTVPASSEEPPKPAEAAEMEAEPPKPEAVEEEKKDSGEPSKAAEKEEEKKDGGEPSKAAEKEEEKKPEDAQKKPESAIKEGAAEPAKEAAPPPSEEMAVAAEDDGEKTVEAIEESVVPVSAAPLQPTTEEVTLIAAEETAEAQKQAEEEAPVPTQAEPEEVSIWGVPLLADERSDTILIKFLRARDFKVKEAFAMLKSAIIWRKVFGIDALLEEDLGLSELHKVVFMHGVDKEGHPVCYNVYGEFQSKELYAKAFGDEQKRQAFLKWRIQVLEKGIREQLDFAPGAICSMVQVTDLKNAPRLGKHRQAMKQAVTLLQDNYPEFTAKNIFINVPWWYLAFNRMMSTIFTQRSKSKMVFAGPSKSVETLFKYIAPEQVPVQYGGLNMENDPDFTSSDPVTEITIKPLSQEIIEIPSTETCLLVWELRVLGWEVSYGCEFTPSAEGAYTVIIQKPRKMLAMDEPIVKTSFKIGEPGKVVITVDNPTSKKKKLLYRTKVKSATEST